MVKPLVIKCHRELYKFKLNFFYTNGINNIVILLRLGMRRQKLSLQNRMIILLKMKAAWMTKVRVKMIRRAFTMMKMVAIIMMMMMMMMMMMVTMAIITTITKYQDYNRYNSSVITKRKDNNLLQIMHFYFYFIVCNTE